MTYTKADSSKMVIVGTTRHRKKILTHSGQGHTWKLSFGATAGYSHEPTQKSRAVKTARLN